MIKTPGCVQQGCHWILSLVIDSKFCEKWPWSGLVPQMCSRTVENREVDFGLWGNTMTENFHFHFCQRLKMLTNIFFNFYTVSWRGNRHYFPISSTGMYQANHFYNATVVIDLQWMYLPMYITMVSLASYPSHRVRASHPLHLLIEQHVTTPRPQSVLWSVWTWARKIQTKIESINIPDSSGKLAANTGENNVSDL